ncbi:hypothetical protein [Candidatus Korobacter versatilis]|uniref:hypothetical protein n=1 Tax=Candidatus Korobacter versatilis TaxID=658062 RepID=UPI0011D109F7|nr:hypothetical protein [Candidatus Koribacter versatilis]
MGKTPRLGKRETWGTQRQHSIYDRVVNGTNEWQRVDDVGCFWFVLRWLLLAWAVLIPYAAMVRSWGWFCVAGACFAAGLWMTWQQKRRRVVQIPEMRVELSSRELWAGEAFAVALQTSGEMAKSVRWWSAEMMASVKGDDPRTVVTAEFAVDPEAEAAPVSELQMILTVPGESELRSFAAREWWVQVTVETQRGRMESGRVPVLVH